MTKSGQEIFKVDRRMELRLRLAAKKNGTRKSFVTPYYTAETAKREVVERIIERVRRL
jgi:hypothetical protein